VGDNFLDRGTSTLSIHSYLSNFEIVPPYTPPETRHQASGASRNTRGRGLARAMEVIVIEDDEDEGRPVGRSVAGVAEVAGVSGVAGVAGVAVAEVA